MYPGQLHQLRKNLHHLVIPINLTSIDDLSLVTDQLRLFVDRKIGIRFGLVPLTGTPEGLALHCIDFAASQDDRTNSNATQPSYRQRFSTIWLRTSAFLPF